RTRGEFEPLNVAAKPAGTELGSASSISPGPERPLKQPKMSRALETPQAEHGDESPSASANPVWLLCLGRYGLALLLVTTAILVRTVAARLVGPGLPTYLTFYPAVMLAALVGGWGPGLLATMTAAFVADYWLLLPRGMLKIANPVEIVGLLFFILAGVLMSLVAELYRRLRGHLTELVLLRTAALSETNERLRTQTQELAELTKSLESKVAERTEELEHRAWQLQKLTLELMEAEERERARIAEILHDDLQQVLAAAKFHVGLLNSRTKNDAKAREIAGQTNDLLADAIAKSRGLSHELASPVLVQSDLGAALEWLVEQMQKKHGFKVHLEVVGRIETASKSLRILLYRAVQELLFNTIKHAGVSEARVRLRRRHGRLRLSVSDRGRGFDPAASGGKPGLGLLNIRERIELLGGRVMVRSTPGKGSTLLIVIPENEADGPVPEAEESGAGSGDIIE
ncbi:MAG: ATP-binding protein, partial [Solirubrobacterales bacterium]